MYKFGNCQNIINQITKNEHDILNLQKALKKMLLGWISSPLEIDPEERLDMVIYYEAIQNHFDLIEKIKTNI